MTTIYKRKLYRSKPIKLNWFDLATNWLFAKGDIAGNWMNNHPFVSSLVFSFAAFFCFFLALGV